MAKKKVSIIGAGMSGLVSGILLARQGHKVTIFERNNKIGKKIMVTGNGRCNISNLNAGPGSYHSMTKNLFQPVFEGFNMEDTKVFFESIGIDFVRLDEGKLYPRSLQAKSVTQALLFECENLKIDIVYETRVKGIEYNGKYKITTDDKSYYSQYLIVATGGRSYGDSGSTGDGYEIAKSFKHHITDTYPTIVQLKTDCPYNKTLKGLKVHAKGRLMEVISKGKTQVLRSDEGEVLFTDYGLSGPVILQLSTMAEPQISQGKVLVVELDFVTYMKEEKLDEYLLKRLHKFSSRSVSDALNGFLNQRLIQPLLKSSGIELNKKAGDVTKLERNELVKHLKAFRSVVTGTYLWNQAQATKGGINCLEVNEQTLESNLQENLFFVGEVLDMDGDCGGFNLQWAISSGAVAAKHISNN